MTGWARMEGLSPGNLPRPIIIRHYTMRHHSSLLLFVLTVLLSGSLHAQDGHQGGRVSHQLMARWADGRAPVATTPFEAVVQDASTRALWTTALQQAEVLRMRPTVLQGILAAPPERLRLELPMAGGLLRLDVERATITTDDFQVRLASTGEALPLPQGVHYQGMIHGQPGSLAAITFHAGEVMGLIADGHGQWVLGRFEEGPRDLHVLYREHHLRAGPTHGCEVREVPGQARREVPMQGSTKTIRCVRYYWEVAHDVYLNKNSSVTQTTNYVTGLFNQSAILFGNDAIDVTLQEVFVWDVPSPYSGSSSNKLDQFGTVRTSFNGDMAHLLDLGGTGGIAWLNTLCNGLTRYRMAYSGINSSYQNVPTYSWSVEVVTHEAGHNLGSPHTHACSWNGNNTAIDGCGPAAGYTEGNCPQGPIPSSSVGGTIMSYCHLTSSTIKFANGFGPQPAQRIINAVNGANCLTTCGSSCDVPSGQVAYSITPTGATLSWAAVGATAYDLRWRPIGGSWTNVNGLTTNTHVLTGLAQGTNHEFQVRSVCGGTSSAYSGSANFSTPSACPDALEPNNTVGTAAVVSLPLSQNALIATANDADYYRITVPSAATLSISLSNLPGDFDVRLLNTGGNQLAISQNGGTQSESITYAAAANDYIIHVFGYNGAFSNIQCYLLNASISGTQGCGQPQNLGTTGLTWNAATLTWGAATGANSYTLRWRPTGAPNWTTVTGINGTSHPLNGLQADTPYEFQVLTVCTGGQSLYSGSHVFTTPNAPCEVAPPIRVALKALLEGPYNTGNQLMGDGLRTAGLLPLQEPYTALGYVLSGTAATTAGVLNTTGANAIVDWVLVELRVANDPGVLVERRAALLQRDGDIVAVDGTSALGLCSPPGSYRIAVRHRNHLGCVTSQPYTLSSSATSVDLTLTGTGTWGTDARKNIGGRMVLWAGNTSGDLLLRYAGSGNDRDPILTAIGGTVPTATVNGYLREDVNLDGTVKYAGTGNDRDPILSNVGGTVPTNTRVEQVP